MTSARATLAFTAVLTVTLTAACSSASHAAGGGSASASARSATQSGTVSATPSPAVQTSGALTGQSALTPDPASTALKHFPVATVTAAMALAQRAALTSVSDQTLLVPGDHPLADYAAEEQFLTRAGRAELAKDLRIENTADPNNPAWVEVTALASSFRKDATFVPDQPAIGRQQVLRVDPKVTLSTSRGVPAMLVQGHVSSVLPGTYKGARRNIQLYRDFQYEIVPAPAGSLTPVLIDRWGYVKFGAKVL